MRVLDVDVPADLLGRWRMWLAPDPQPFYLSPSEVNPPGTTDGEMTLESRDTFRSYAMDPHLSLVWLSEASFGRLPRATRAALVRTQARSRRGAVPIVRRWMDVLDLDILRSQADGHRFVWWPSLLAENVGTILQRVVSERRMTSRHREVSAATWRRCEQVLPRARMLAGTFPECSGPNCFTTVLEACGRSDLADAWAVREPFDDWLAGSTHPGGEDNAPGTVFVWRDAEGLSQHAAVTIGDGWALEKQSQDWHAPCVILPVRDLITANRTRGQRLHRRTLS